MWRAYSSIVVDLGTPGGPGLGDDLGIGDGAVEIAVGIRGGGEQPGRVLARHQHPERPALHLGQVTYQAQQRHRRRLDGTSRHGLRVEVHWAADNGFSG
jgi:hypothetical protein